MKFLVFFSTVLLFFSCNKQEGNDPSNDYSWLYGTMSVVQVQDDASERIKPLTTNPKAKSVGAGSIVDPLPNMAATGIAFLPNNVMVVSYHGREGVMAGALELFEVTDSGLIRGGYGHLSFGARINNITTDNNNRIFAAMDTKDGPVMTVIEIKDGLFMVKETVKYVKLPGESANGLLFVKGDDGREYVFSATGGDGSYQNEMTEDAFEVYNFDGTKKIALQEFRQRPGFQKSLISGLDITPISIQGNGNNRGKWIASDGQKMATLHFSKYVNSAHASVQLYDGFINKFYQGYTDFPRIAPLDAQTTMYGKNVALLTPGASSGENVLYLCLDNKGFQSFGFSEQNKKESRHISTFDKRAVAAAFDADGLIYVACGGQGLYVLNNTFGEFTPLKSYKQKGASANFVAIKDQRVCIAYGSDGLVVLDKNSPLFTAE